MGSSRRRTLLTRQPGGKRLSDAEADESEVLDAAHATHMRARQSRLRLSVERHHNLRQMNTGNFPVMTPDGNGGLLD